MSQVGYVNNMYGNTLNFVTTNADGATVLKLDGENVLTPNALIITSPTDENNNDLGTPSIIVTDTDGSPLRISYTMQPGKGLINEPNTDILRMNLDEHTIQSKKDSKDLDAIYVNAYALINYNSTLEVVDENDLRVNVADIIDNSSLKTASRYIRDNKAFEDQSGKLYESDKIFVDTSYIIDNFTLTTVNSNINKKTGEIISEDVDKTTLLNSNAQKISVNVKNIVDNQTIIPKLTYSEYDIHEEKVPIYTPMTYEFLGGVLNNPDDVVSIGDRRMFKARFKYFLNALYGSPENIWYMKYNEYIGSTDDPNSYTLIISDNEWSKIDWQNISDEKVTELANRLSEPPMYIYQFDGYEYVKELIPKGVPETLAYVDTQALTKTSKTSYGVIKIDEKTLRTLGNGTVSVKTNYLDTITNKESKGIVKVYPEGTQSEHIFGTASGTLRVNPEYLPKATSYNTGKKYKGYGVCAVDGTSTYTNQIGVISVNTQNLEKAEVNKYGVVAIDDKTIKWTSIRRLDKDPIRRKFVDKIAVNEDALRICSIHKPGVVMYDSNTLGLNNNNQLYVKNAEYWNESIKQLTSQITNLQNSRNDLQKQIIYLTNLLTNSGQLIGFYTSIDAGKNNQVTGANWEIHEWNRGNPKSPLLTAELIGTVYMDWRYEDPVIQLFIDNTNESLITNVQLQINDNTLSSGSATTVYTNTRNTIKFKLTLQQPVSSFFEDQICKIMVNFAEFEGPTQATFELNVKLIPGIIDMSAIHPQWSETDIKSWKYKLNTTTAPLKY